MDIIFQGKHNTEEAAESLASIIDFFNVHYRIHQFREIHLSLTLVDDQGHDVELIDSDTLQAYRVFEVYRQGYDIVRGRGLPVLKLVVDNTR